MGKCAKDGEGSSDVHVRVKERGSSGVGKGSAQKQRQERGSGRESCPPCPVMMRCQGGGRWSRDTGLCTAVTLNNWVLAAGVKIEIRLQSEVYPMCESRSVFLVEGRMRGGLPAGKRQCRREKGQLHAHGILQEGQRHPCRGSG